MDKEQFIQKEKEHYDLMERKVGYLQRLYDEKKFKEYWSEVKEVNSLMKSLNPLFKEHRYYFQIQINTLCEKIKQKQQENAEIREQARNNSETKRRIILNLIEEALSYTSNSEGIEKSTWKLDKANQYLKDGWVKVTEELFSPLFGLGDGYMTREDKDYCWNKWKEAKNEIYRRKAEIKNYNYATIKDRLYRISDLADYGDPYEALEEIKITRNKMKGLAMDKWQFEELNRSLNEYWEKVIKRINSKREEKSKKWRSGMEDKASYLLSLIEKNESFIERLMSQIDDLQDKLSNARSDEFRERVEGWIDEKKEKIRDVMRNNEEITSKVRGIRDELSG